MSTMRNIKKKMVKDATANPHRRRFLIKHSKVTSEITTKKKFKKVRP